MPSEYRVRWQREGCQRSYRIYQTEGAARRKVSGLLALEEIKSSIEQFCDMGNLVEGPDIQVREVGEWRASGVATSPPDEYTKKRVAEHFGVFDDAVGFGDWPL